MTEAAGAAPTTRLWRRAADLFERCLELSPPEREAFLEENCDDPEIRRRTIDLLRRAAVVETVLLRPTLTEDAGPAPDKQSGRDRAIPNIPPFVHKFLCAECVACFLDY